MCQCVPGASFCTGYQAIQKCGDGIVKIALKELIMEDLRIRVV